MQRSRSSAAVRRGGGASAAYVDASRNALGAILVQGGRPIEFASRRLTDAQRPYEQVEKEFLARL